VDPTPTTTRAPDAAGVQSPPPSLARLFLSFLRLGLTSFGGPAMVVYIRELAVRKRGWLSEETFADGVALCQTVPGATAMQTAAYVGLRAGGPVGALASFVGFGLPAFVLMLILSAVYQATEGVPAVVSTFRGLHVVVIAIIAGATVSFGRASIRNWRDVLPAAGAAAFLVFGGNPIIAIPACGLLGTFLYMGMDIPARPGPKDARGSARKYLAFAALLALCAAAGIAALFFVSRMLFDLSLLMMKVDVFAFGGGFASVPIMLHEVVDARQWMDSKVFMDGLALGQVTPGPVVITATFVGYQLAGIWGAVVGTLAIFTPSFLMVLITVPYFDRMQRSLFFRRAIRGILGSFVGLLFAVALHFGIAVHWNIAAAALAVCAFAALQLKVDILWVVLAGGLVSVFLL
jgi:chromate transporter